MDTRAAATTGVPLLAKLVVNLLEHVSLHAASGRIKFAAAVRKIYAARANARLLMSKYIRSTNDSARTALVALEKNAQQPAVGGLPATCCCSEQLAFDERPSPPSTAEFAPDEPPHSTQRSR